RLKLVPESLAELRQLGCHYERAITLQRIIPVVVLVISLRLVIGACRRQFRYDRRVPDISHFRNHLLGGVFLLRRLIVNDGSVLGTDIITLPVQRGGIMYGEKHFE